MNTNLNEEFENYFRVKAKDPAMLAKVKKAAEARGLSYLDAYCAIAPKFKDRAKLEKKLREMHQKEGLTLDGSVPNTNQPDISDEAANAGTLADAYPPIDDDLTLPPKDSLLDDLVELGESAPKAIPVMPDRTKTMQDKIKPNDRTKTMPKPAESEEGIDVFAEAAKEFGEKPVPNTRENKTEQIKTKETYKIEKKLGAGGMGDVYTATDLDLERTVALKRMKGNPSEDQIARFLTEAKATGQLEHPNIVPVHALVRDPVTHQYYFTMKKVEGEDLEHIVDHKSGDRIKSILAKKAKAKDEGKLTPEAEKIFAEKLAEARNDKERCIREYDQNSLLRIFINACNGIAFAHSKGYIHRDLKPANIMVGEFGEVLVMDFGLAKKLGTPAEQDRTGLSVIPHKENPGLTMDGVVMGTPVFMPPEQAEGKLAEIDEKSDQYSLGATLYNLLSLRKPISGNSAQEVVLKSVNGDINRLPRTVPKELQSIIYKAMSQNKGERYASVQELADDVQNYLDGKIVNAHHYGIIGHTTRFFKKHALKIVGAAALGIAGLTGTAVVMNANTQRAKAEAKAEKEEAAKIKANEKTVLAEKDKAKAEAETANATAAKKTAEAKTLEAKAEAATLRAENAEIAAESDRKARERRDRSNALIKKGYLYDLNREYAEAIRIFTDAIEADPLYAEAYFNRAESHLKNRKNNPVALENALNDALKAKQLDPKNNLYSASYAGILEETGKIEEAEQVWIQILQSKEDIHPIIIFNIGAFYSRRIKPEKALQFYNEYAEKMPNDIRVYAKRANEYNNQKQYSLAKTEALTALEKKDFKAYYELAFAEYSTGEYDKAEEHFKLAKQFRDDRNKEIEFALNELEKLKQKK